MRLAEGNIKPNDITNLEDTMKDLLNQVWHEDLIVEDMETEQVWYQIEEILKPYANNNLGPDEDFEEEIQDQSEQNDDEMEEEDINEDEDDEYDQSINEYVDEDEIENEEYDERMEEEEVSDEEDDDENDQNEDKMEEEDVSDEENDQENISQNQNMNDENNSANDDNENDSYNQYDFNDEEYNQYLDEMDEQDLNQEDNENDEEELEMDEEDESDNEEEKESEAEEDQEDVEDVFRTLAYGTHEKNIEQIENKLIEKKSWQLQGEIRAHDREKNTLLEEDLEFQRGIQTKTKIGKEVNDNFEAIIKQRILDVAFDDRSSSTYFNKLVVNEQIKDLPELDFEKDKRGLIGVYEEQYKKSVMGIDEKKSKEDKVKDQIKDLYRLICFSIDNMTRFQYNPTVIPLADKKATDGFIIDEKIPVVVSGDLLKDRKTYKEVYDAKDKELKSKAEMTKEEKLRLRRKIKRTMKVKRDRLKQKEIERTGMRGSDYKMLEKNQSKVRKQIQDSKASGATKFTRQSEFFSTISKNVV